MSRRSVDPHHVRRAALRLLIFTAAVAGVLASVDPVSAGSCWRPPVEAPITDPFRPPRCAWCHGNRGLEFGTPAGRRVLAVASGRVSYAGRVAGVRYVVVEHAAGRRVTYGNLGTATVRTGELVVRGMLLGRTAGRLHFGLRDGDRYIDPAPHLGRLVRRARLIPTDGSTPNPAPPPILRCRPGPPTVGGRIPGGAR